MIRRAPGAGSALVAALLAGCSPSPREPLLATVTAAAVDRDTGGFAALQAAGVDFEVIDVAANVLRPVDRDTLDLRLRLGRFGNHLARLDRFERTPAGVEVWSGTLAGMPDRWIVVSRTGEQVAALVQLDARQIVRVHRIGGIFADAIVERIDPTPLGPELPPVSPEPAGPTASPDTPEPACPPQQIDIMVAYLDAELDNLGGIAVIETEVAAMVTVANQSLRSASDHQFVLRSIVPVPDVSARGFEALLSAMKHGWIPRLHRLRDSVGADLVVLWMPYSDECGIAYALDDIPGGRPEDAFAVVSRLCATSTWTLAHELGHLLGAEHDRATAAVEARNRRIGPAQPWGYGYRDPVGKFRDLMAYPCADHACDFRHFHYSTPQIPGPNGRQYGVDHAVNPDSSADVARMLRSTACVVAAYRPTTLPLPPDLVP